ncbi:hypothetical protein LVJ94_03410 [Pendulispora rubella]|uniref:Asparagine synthetase domain-containing protein n=1 Tax=Pendulispora rubella TaxID=2741070 RepID=A0ABZ2L5S5_9BACT
MYVKDARRGHGNFDIVIPFMNDDLMRTVAGLPVGIKRELLHDALLDRAGFVAGRIGPTTVRRLLSEHQAGADHSRVLWALLFLEFWQKGVRT